MLTCKCYVFTLLAIRRAEGGDPRPESVRLSLVFAIAASGYIIDQA